MRGCSVDCRLNLLKRGLQGRFIAVQKHIYLEEWLQHLLGCISAATNSLLHLIEGVLSGMEEGLVH